VKCVERPPTTDWHPHQRATLPVTVCVTMHLCLCGVHSVRCSSDRWKWCNAGLSCVIRRQHRKFSELQLNSQSAVCCWSTCTGYEYFTFKTGYCSCFILSAPLFYLFLLFKISFVILVNMLVRWDSFKGGNSTDSAPWCVKISECSVAKLHCIWHNISCSFWYESKAVPGLLSVTVLELKRQIAHGYEWSCT